MSRAEVAAQLVERDARQGTQGTVHVLVQVVEKEMRSHVLQQQLLTPGFTRQRGFGRKR